MKKFYKKICSVFIIPLILSVYSGADAAEYVIPSGETVGIKIYTEGIMVAGVSEFKDENGNDVCPARDAGIRAGDVIKSVNGRGVLSCDDFSELESSGPIECEITRGEELLTAKITPLSSEDGKYRIGLWARDSTAGIGTLTFINPETMRYCALGHAVTDVDSGAVMEVNKGNIANCRIVSVKAGHIGLPGSVAADFGDEILGSIDYNGENGISGALSAPPPEYSAVPVSSAAEVYDGAAQILSNVEGGEVKAYGAEVNVISTEGVRNMTVKITDDRLIEATGGIVQGMSGAPIMQDGRLIGAVTHVFVNDPKKGYAIFAENMAD